MSNQKNEYNFEFPIEGVYLVTIFADTLEEAKETSARTSK